MFAQLLRRLLPAAVFAAVALALLPSSPAVAASPGYPPSFRNNSAWPVAWVDGWCDGDHDDLAWEEMPCGTTRFMSPGGGQAPSSADPDGIRSDANCSTTYQLLYGSGTTTSFTDNQRNNFSIWHRYHNAIVPRFQVIGVTITGKVCYWNLRKTGSNQSSISIAWDPIPNADYKVYINGVYKAWVPGSSGSAYTAYNLNAATSYTFAVSMVRGGAETIKSETITATTGPAPPPPWQYNTARQLRNAQSGLCLVVQGSSDGSQAFMHDCSIPYADQLWVTRAGNGGGTEIANANSGMCLVTPYWFDYGVTQTYCDIYPDSKWEILDSGPTYRLRNVNLGTCLVGSTTFAYNATMAPCSSALDQKWSQR